MTLFTDPRLAAAGLTGGTLSRQAGSMTELSNQHAAFEQFCIPPQKILHFQQTHSTTLVHIQHADQPSALVNAPLLQADAWLFAPAVAGWGAAIVTADCVPLFLWAKDGSAWALAHCGWRGIAKQLPFLTATALRRHTSQRLCVWAGPHIQACCFEVQQDTASQFPPEIAHQRNGRTFLDLNLALRAQLTKAGIDEKDMVISPRCTCCEEQNFFSWRRDHVRQLLLSFLYKPTLAQN